MPLLVFCAGRWNPPRKAAVLDIGGPDACDDVSVEAAKSTFSSNNWILSGFETISVAAICAGCAYGWMSDWGLL
jgi:hypothetical protein